ncbi:uncharacterized protein LOC141597408 [Silene latifolia]|uniref:uncharacterized protein LOC141597408 n=1 Tax=Silene latifolia TaxID=37657 RepID=UPI003D789137
MALFSTRADESKTAPEMVYRHIQCTPLVDVLSITIGNRLDNVDRSKSCEIYGKIRVLDTQHGSENEMFSFFSKDKDNAEYVQFDEPLLLTTPSPTPVIEPSKNICLDVSLFIRRADSVVVASEKIILDKKGDECEEFHDIEIDSQEDNMVFVHVHYTVIQYAVAATIDLLFFSKDDKFDFSIDAAADDKFDFSIDADDDDANDKHIEEPRDFVDVANYDERDCGDSVAVDVFGTVRGHSNLKAANGKDWHPILLFKKSPSQGVQVKSGGFIQLSRSAVILPAYSSALVIEVDLSYCEGDIRKPIASNKLEFQLHSEDTYKKDLVGEHGERIRVRVTWNESYIKKTEKAREERQEPHIPRVRDPVQWLEMFSVVLYRKDFKPFSFYGTIRVIDAWGEHFIFCKDKKHSQISPESGALATLKNAYFHSLKVQGCYLAIVDLRDAETEDTISLGTVQWDEMVIEPWLDKRLCSIVRGEQGFAALHCNAFYDGICAFFNMKLGGEHLPGYVYGKIVARYSTYKYSTAYDKKYYQITLFDNESEDYGSQQAAQTRDSSLPLLKPVVCLARGSFLIVEVNLRVSSKRPFDCNSHQGAKFLQGIVELVPGIETPQRLGGEPCFIDVHVGWKLR